MKYETPHSFTMRNPCKRDGCTIGNMETVNGQRSVYCAMCGHWQYEIQPIADVSPTVKIVIEIHVVHD